MPLCATPLSALYGPFVSPLELPAGTEFLDLLSPQYIADLVAWAEIGRAHV